MATAHDRKVLNRILNPLMPDTDPEEEKQLEDKPINHAGIEESRELERQAIKMAETGRIDDAMKLFDRAVEVCRINPSAYNNRAQARRMNNDTEGALLDLDEAIKLSGGQGKSACQALTQRALIKRLKGDDDGARADYEQASSLGSSFAKMQLVALNPYAAMCNKMLAEVMGNMRQPKCE
ncbi:unnamed protein product, partial [Mesorhabditis spiculigera]